MNRLSFILYCLLLNWTCLAQTSTKNADWDDVALRFQREYPNLEIAPLQIAYMANLENIQSHKSVLAQERFFRHFQTELQRVPLQELTPEQQIDYEVLDYQIQLHLTRIGLEKKWRSNPPDTISTQGLSQVPNGKAWYAYFLQKWVDQSATPDQLFQFGMAEVTKVKGAMRAIQEASGMDSITFQQHLNHSDFFYPDVPSIQSAFENIKTKVANNAATFFPATNTISEVGIALSTNPAMAQVPGYYNAETFFYVFFDRPYNKRQIVWLYLHEAVPGHHYERSYTQQLSRSPITGLFRYPCYAEGWAAYVEEIGKEIGAYQTIYDEYGKWEWDLIRSVRVPLDVGLNYYGWSDEQALTFWRQYIHGLDDIGRREIARMKRWPAQVITYKYGANKILTWKKQEEQQAEFDLKAFHQKVLEHGPLPFSVMEKWFFKNQLTTK